ncbi:hypothetical protein TNCV_4547941 [Trichonephila clavipes]|nr:hypothetical protein TNCV_4547941 [Trichonephila clavipes]
MIGIVFKASSDIGEKFAKLCNPADCHPRQSAGLQSLANLPPISALALNTIPIIHFRIRRGPVHTVKAVFLSKA